jgi:hypothetical protein
MWDKNRARTEKCNSSTIQKVSLPEHNCEHTSYSVKISLPEHNCEHTSYSVKHKNVP